MARILVADDDLEQVTLRKRLLEAGGRSGGHRALRAVDSVAGGPWRHRPGHYGPAFPGESRRSRTDLARCERWAVPNQ